MPRSNYCFGYIVPAVRGIIKNIPAGGTKMNRTLLFSVTILIFVLCAAVDPVFAFEDKLGDTSNNTTVDGTIHKSEYSYTRTFKEATLYLNRNRGDIYIGVSVKTDGWIGVGFNSDVMNNAHIFIGYVDSGNPIFREQTGSGHKHVDADVPFVRTYTIIESRGSTVLEFALNEKNVIKKGQKNLEMILAYGEKDSLSSYHGKTREGFSVPLE